MRAFGHRGADLQAQVAGRFAYASGEVCPSGKQEIVLGECDLALHNDVVA
jgi:hypothetical protein